MNCAADSRQIPAYADESLRPRVHKTPMKPGRAGFCRGVIACLILTYSESGRLLTGEWRGLLQATALDDLVKVAKRDGDMKASGLSEYLRSQA